MLSVLLLAALVAGAGLTYLTQPTSVDEALLQVDIDEGEPHIALAFNEYGQAAQQMLVLYGHRQETQEVLRWYGPQIVPIVAKCLSENGDMLIETSNYFDELMSAAWERRRPQFAELEPVDCGWKAIVLAHEMGNDFLGQFIIDHEQKVAVRFGSNTFFGTLKGQTISGIQDLEKKLTFGEIPTFADLGWAAADVLVITAARKGFQALAKGGAKATAGVATKQTARTAAKRTLAVAAKYSPTLAKAGAVVGTAYLITHPDALTGLVGEVAKLMGWNPLLLQFGFWSLLSLALLLALRLAFRPIQWVFRPVVWLLR